MFEDAEYEGRMEPTYDALYTLLPIFLRMEIYLLLVFEINRPTVVA